MSFDVHLLPSSRSPETGEAFRAGLDGALRAMGARGELESVIDFPNGGSVEVFAGGDEPGAMLAFRDFGLSHAEATFQLAEATASFILTDGEQGTFKVPSAGEAPDDYPEPFVAVADGTALLALVEASFAAWADYRDQVVATAKPKSFFGRLRAGLTGKS